jgi:lysophospholipase L1-like esterase
MPFDDKDVNTRNSTKTEMIGKNNVHPSVSGYNQIADAMYRHFTKNYCV